MSSKIRIKMGSVEVEYEGSEEFLREELKDLLAAVIELHREGGGDQGSDFRPSLDDSGNGVSGNVTLTTASIAAKLNVSSGPDLAMAAAAQLTLVQKKDSFSRKDLLKEMKTAKSYYKITYGKNLSQTLTNLIAGKKLIETSENVYAVSAAEVKILEAALAQ